MNLPNAFFRKKEGWEAGLMTVKRNILLTVLHERYLHSERRVCLEPCYLLGPGQILYLSHQWNCRHRDPFNYLSVVLLPLAFFVQFMSPAPKVSQQRTLHK